MVQNVWGVFCVVCACAACGWWVCGMPSPRVVHVVCVCVHATTTVEPLLSQA